MSAASESSGPSNSSGRSSPDDVPFGVSGGGAAAATTTHSHAFSPFGAGWTTRRSSTPASSFLPAKFWGMTEYYPPQQQQQQQAPKLVHAHTTSGGKLQQDNPPVDATSTASSQSSSSQPAALSNSVPRRTSFGHVLGGNRLSAFSAFGLGPSSPYWSTPSANVGSQTPQASSATDPLGGELRRKPSIAEESVSSANTTPAPSMPSSPVQRPSRKVYLPGPDGLICESRPKRRNDA